MLTGEGLQLPGKRQFLLSSAPAWGSAGRLAKNNGCRSVDVIASVLALRKSERLEAASNGRAEANFASGSRVWHGVRGRCLRKAKVRAGMLRRMGASA